MQNLRDRRMAEVGTPARESTPPGWWADHTRQDAEEQEQPAAHANLSLRAKLR